MGVNTTTLEMKPSSTATTRGTSPPEAQIETDETSMNSVYCVRRPPRSCKDNGSLVFQEVDLANGFWLGLQDSCKSKPAQPTCPQANLTYFLVGRCG
ncbi:hypothetical protein DPEC_G00150080 [Dallia pectoralis]|uniref:Uncharacterized protein n=1 Tax=Dallia pectoralis TaxID=75939 RepID=A0ACC2GJF1_DALPE|nr:hypothetical protein DPEC_G00150080 [Dallia pectoralis]